MTTVCAPKLTPIRAPACHNGNLTNIKTVLNAESGCLLAFRNYLFPELDLARNRE